jgi:hypothetical protein
LLTTLSLLLLASPPAILAKLLPIPNADVITTAINATENALSPNGYYLDCKNNAETKGCASFLGTISAWARDPKQRRAAHPCGKDCRCSPVCPDMPLLPNFAKLCPAKRDETVDTESGEVVEH